jgi:diguanylate cyclase (GGDEF)-like protein
VIPAFANRNRDALLQKTRSCFKQLQYENPYIQIMTFRLTDGSTFLRVHKPEMYGDALNRKRKIILDTNALQREHFGFEIGKLKMTYRIVIPIFHKEQHVGLVEMGIDPAYFMGILSRGIALKSVLVVRNNMIDVLQNSEHFVEKGNYAISEGTPFYRHIFNNATLDQRTFTQYDGKSYALYSGLKLYSHDRLPAAFILTAEDVSDTLSAHRLMQAGVIIAIAFFLILLFFVLNYSMNFYLGKIHKQLYTDGLTALPNRYALLKQLQSRPHHILMLIDINGFKSINELYGVDQGNIILQQFANFLTAQSERSDMQAFRISSDEFVILARSTEDLGQPRYEEIINQLLHQLKSTKFTLHDLDVTIELEVTVGAVCNHEVSLEKADMALVQSRERKLLYLFYSPDIDTKRDTHKVIAVKKDLRHAIENDNIVAYYQPIVDAKGNIVKYESLVRMLKMVEGEMQVISPAAFLELSQEFNLYPQIAKIMITKAFEKVDKTHHTISVNLTPGDIMDTQMQQYIFDKLGQCKKPQNLIFEITENENIKDYDYVKHFVRNVHRYGAKIAIDDFGSGYSNYTHIFELRPDYLKIDGSLIRHIHENRESQVFVKTITTLANELGIKTIAEFICCKEVHEAAKGFGIDEFQGYFIGEPSPDL